MGFQNIETPKSSLTSTFATVTYPLAAYVDGPMPNDGATDAQAAIQAGIADMWARAQADAFGVTYILELPAGAFRIDSYLIGTVASTGGVPLSRVGIRGAGMDKTVIRPQGGISAFVFGSPGNDWDDPAASRCTFSDFTIDMEDATHPGTDTPAYKGFVARGVHDCLFENITIRNSPATAFGTDYPVRTTFSNCHVDTTGAGAAASFSVDYGITSAAASVSGFGMSLGLSDNESALLINCTATNCYRSGFFFESAPQASATLRESAVRLIGCRSYGNKIGVAIAGCGGVEVSDCDIHDNTRAGIFTGATELSVTQAGLDVTIRGNRITNNGVGIYSTGAKKDSYTAMVSCLGGHRIEGNRIHDNTGAGFQAQRFTTIEAGGLVITGNSFRRNGGGGINIGRGETPARDVTITGNEFDSNTGAAISIVCPMNSPRIEGNNFYNSSGSAQTTGIQLSAAEAVTLPVIQNNTFRQITTPMFGVSRLTQTHVTGNRELDGTTDPATATRLHHEVIYGTSGNWPAGGSGWLKNTVVSQSDWIRPTTEGMIFTATENYSFIYRDLGTTGAYMETRLNSAPATGESQPLGIFLALQSGSTRTMICAGVNDMLAGFTSDYYCVWTVSGGTYTLLWTSAVPAIEAHSIALARTAASTVTDVYIDGVKVHSADITGVAASQLAGVYSRWVTGGTRRLSDVRAMAY